MSNGDGLDICHFTKLPQMVKPRSSPVTNSSELRQVTHSVYWAGRKVPELVDNVSKYKLESL